MAGINFTLGNNYIKRATLVGLTCSGGVIRPDKSSPEHYLIMPVIDSGINDCAWGRLKFDCPDAEGGIVYTWLFASNDRGAQEFLLEPEYFDGKKKRFEDAGGIRAVNKKDFLLYELSGRYLWLMMEIAEGSPSIENLKISAPGDVFLPTFPEVYRERGSFFHRYLSVFSSLYNDFQESIDHREELLDLEKADIGRLGLYARWLGIDVGNGMFDEDCIRELIKKAGMLTRTKGTRRCLEEICKIIIGEKPVIVERNVLGKYERRTEKDRNNQLFGESPYDVTFIFYRQIEEVVLARLMLLLGQFKPVRCEIKVLCLESGGVMDGHTYMDINASTFQQEPGMLDAGQMSNGTSILS